MTSLENNGQDMDLTELEVMEPKMMIHDELKVIYINFYIRCTKVHLIFYIEKIFCQKYEKIK